LMEQVYRILHCHVCESFYAGYGRNGSWPILSCYHSIFFANWEKVTTNRNQDRKSLGRS